MPTNNDLIALRQRVKEAEGPDRGLDAEIACALDPDICRNPNSWGDVEFSCGDVWFRGSAKKVTASVDVALALAEAKLPAWRVPEIVHIAMKLAWQWALSRTGTFGQWFPLAILAALLTALIEADTEAGR
jgi:hypothetical protein